MTKLAPKRPPPKPLYKPPPAPPGKSYLPTFAAPEAYGKKKQVVDKQKSIMKAAQQQIAKEAAQKEKEKAHKHIRDM